MSMNIKETLKFLDLIKKTPLRPMLVGGTGVSKTAVVRQKAKLENKDLIVIHVAQLEPSDFVGLYKTTADGRTQNCPPMWLPYKEPREVELKKGQPIHEVLPQNSGYINPNGGIIFMDEANRGHEDIRQALYQFINEGKLHTYTKPENYEIVLASNPTDGFETYEWDPALINRCAWVQYVPEWEETREHLKAAYGNNPFLAWANSDPKMIDYGADFKLPERLFSPRTLETGMALWNEVQNESDIFQRKSFQTILKDEYVQGFLAFIRELSNISIEDIVAGKQKAKIDEYIKNKRMDVLSTLVGYLAEAASTYSIGMKNHKLFKSSTELDNLVEFLDKMPSELLMTFLDSLGNYGDEKSIVRYPNFLKTLKPKLAKYKEVV